MVEPPPYLDLVKNARASGRNRGFTQSFELVVALKDIDLKKSDLSISEIVFLPNSFSDKPRLCLFASGDLAVRARKTGVERVLELNELDKLASDRRGARKFVDEYDFFLAEAPLMPKIGKALGMFLGPRGKMPAPIPPNAPLDALLSRYSQATRIKSRAQLAVACKVGDEKMADEKIAENISSVLGAIEKKLPSGSRNIRGLIAKLSMSPPVELLMKEV